MPSAVGIVSDQFAERLRPPLGIFVLAGEVGDD